MNANTVSNAMSERIMDLEFMVDDLDKLVVQLLADRREHHEKYDKLRDKYYKCLSDKKYYYKTLDEHQKNDRGWFSLF